MIGDKYIKNFAKDLILADFHLRIIQRSVLPRALYGDAMFMPLGGASCLVCVH